MRSLSLDRRRRREKVRLAFDVYTPTRQFRLIDEFDFRTYTARQFQSLLDQVPELELVETYDFAYDVDQPVRIDGLTEDVVYVLRRK